MYRSVLTNKSFLYYLLGGGISRLGDVLSGLAFPFLALDLTGSALYTTGVVIAETVPYLLFGLVGGVIADWVQKKRLLIWIDLLRAPIVFSVFFLHQADLLTYGYLVFIGFLIQSLGCFFNPAHRAVLPMITSAAERTAANSLNDTTTRGIEVLSPVLTFILLKSLGLASFFAFDAATYLVSACFLSLIQLQETRPQVRQKRSVGALFSAIREFALWVKGERTLRKLFLVTFVTVFFNTWVWEVGLLLQVKMTVPDGEAWFSTLKGAFGGMVIAVNLLIPLIWKQLTLKTYLLGAAVWGLGVLSLGTATWFPLTFLGVVIAGMGMPLAGLSRVYLLQQLLPESKLGRGFSFNALLLYAANVLSLGFFVVLSSVIPLRLMFVLCGGMMVFAAAVYLYLLRKAAGEMQYTRLNS